MWAKQTILLDAFCEQPAAFTPEFCAVPASCARLQLQKAFGARYQIEVDPSAKELSTRP